MNQWPQIWRLETNNHTKKELVTTHFDAWTPFPTRENVVKNIAGEISRLSVSPAI